MATGDCSSGRPSSAARPTHSHTVRMGLLVRWLTCLKNLNHGTPRSDHTRCQLGEQPHSCLKQVAQRTASKSPDHPAQRSCLSRR